MADLSTLKIDDRSRKAGKKGQRLGWLAACLIVLLAARLLPIASKTRSLS